MASLAVILEYGQDILVECRALGLIGRKRSGRTLHSQCRYTGQQNENEKSSHTLLRFVGAVYENVNGSILETDLRDTETQRHKHNETPQLADFQRRCLSLFLNQFQFIHTFYDRRSSFTGKRDPLNSRQHFREIGSIIFSDANADGFFLSSFHGHTSGMQQNW